MVKMLGVGLQQHDCEQALTYQTRLYFPKADGTLLDWARSLEMGIFFDVGAGMWSRCSAGSREWLWQELMRALLTLLFKKIRCNAFNFPIALHVVNDGIKLLEKIDFVRKPASVPVGESKKSLFARNDRGFNSHPGCWQLAFSYQLVFGKPDRDTIVDVAIDAAHSQLQDIGAGIARLLYLDLTFFYCAVEQLTADQKTSVIADRHAVKILRPTRGLLRRDFLGANGDHVFFE